MSSVTPKALGLLFVSTHLSYASTIVAVELLSTFNAVTTGDYFPQGADTEGRVLVGGTFTASSSLPVNSVITSNPVAVYANDFSFVNSGKVKPQNGTNIVTPSSPSASDFELTGGSQLISGSAGQAATDALFNSLGISAANLSATMISASASWSQLTETDVVVANGNNPTFNAGSGVAVFDIAPGEVFSQNYNPQFTKEADTTAILINVSGAAIDNTSFGQNLDNIPEEFRRLIIWNFYEAETLDLSKFGGAIFAPNADVVITEPNGSVVSKTLLHTAELHMDLFEGADPIPEPRSLLLLLLSLGTWSMRRRR